MNGHGASYAKHDLVIILIVTDAADGTTSIILGNLCTLLQTKLLDPIFKLFPLCLGRLILNRVQLIHDLAIPDLISTLLRQFELLEEVRLQLARIVDV